MRWIRLGAVGITAYALGVRHGENSVMRALCIALNGRDDLIHHLRKEIHFQRTTFNEAYEHLDTQYEGISGVVDLVSRRLTTALDGVPEQLANRILPLVDALQRVVDTKEAT